VIGFIGWVFLQAIMGGAVTMALAIKNYPAAFVAAYLLNQLWWHNIGQRIDYHGVPRMGIYYALTVATGTTLGAWLLDRIGP